ncbi:MAG: hypothetical protein ACM3JD_12890 [Rudaea sp.]
MDISDLLRELNARRVQYVVVGASAFPTHGYLRATADIDVLIAPNEENAQRTLEALAEVGYDVSGLDPSDLLKMKRAANRKKDQADLDALREIKKRQRRQKRG